MPRTGRKRECKAQQACAVKHEAEEAEEAGTISPSKRRRIGQSSESFGAAPAESRAAADASASTGSETAARGGPVLTRVRNIAWNRHTALWCVSWTEAGKNRQVRFPISKHLAEGLSEKKAVAAALEEAKAFREDLVRRGKLKHPKPLTSTVRGVRRTPTGSFLVQLRNPRTRKLQHGGSFETLAEAEAKARKLAKKLGLRKQLHGQVVPVELSDLPRFEPLGPEQGVAWQIRAQAWYARCLVKGKNRCKIFRPKDLSEKEVQKAWKKAVAWRKRQEKERERAKRSRKQY